MMLEVEDKVKRSHVPDTAGGQCRHVSSGQQLLQLMKVVVVVIVDAVTREDVAARRPNVMITIVETRKWWR